MSWRLEAACRDLDSDYFFWGYNTHGGSVDKRVRRVALSTCGSCQVRAECLTYAMENMEPEGVWGGLTPRQRRRLRDPRVGPRGSGLDGGLE